LKEQHQRDAGRRLKADRAGRISCCRCGGSGHSGGITLAALVEQDVDELSFYCWALDVALSSQGETEGPTAEEVQ
jgi:hypothetical protein